MGSIPGPQSQPPLPPERARTVLRKLRDLDLRSCPVAIHEHLSVRIEGCISLDEPVEESLRYRLQGAEGAAHVLDIRWSDGLLELALAREEGELARSRVRLLVDEEGCASAPEIQARMDPDSADPREVEHFLRHLVRGAFRNAC